MKHIFLAIVLAGLAACAPKPEAPRAEAPKPEAPAAEMPLLSAEPKASGTMMAPPAAAAPKPANTEESRAVKNPLGLSDEEWKKKLSAEEYYVCRQQGTERPGTGKLLHYKGTGTFVCAACGHPLFEAKAKFESGTGWPSFYQAIGKDAVSERGDLTHGMTRVEANCAKCGSHLGHVFDDGPAPTGLRYCMNSVSLKVVEKDEPKK